MIGNIIQPNGESSGGGGGIPHITDMTAITMFDTSRFSVIEGGYKTIGNKCYVNVVFKLNFNLTSSETFPFIMYDVWQMRTNALPTPRDDYSNILSVSWMKKTNNYWSTCSYGDAWVKIAGSGNAELFVTSIENLNGTDQANEYWVMIKGEYDI